MRIENRVEGQTWPYTQVGFFLKTKSGLWELIFEPSRFWSRREEKKREGARVSKRSSFGWLCFPFLAPKRPSNIQEEI